MKQKNYGMTPRIHFEVALLRDSWRSVDSRGFTHRQYFHAGSMPLSWVQIG
ncbi:hypothetical protein FHR92_001531 [Fontibacillus solani]|uniref:Uncharacterized protein n=1 Tax=Fontibacillus solani TaxID=1572857 RepID=A0A7W3XR18_9BACL|nr:hypothetical protein [Fontibacillus solani]MBA9085069.1 hypothetical protein [Fontibacillus solani]